MTDLGDVLDASSGCGNMRTREASNGQQDQPPAPPGVGEGNSLILSTTGKRRKLHNPPSSGLTGPNQESSQEGPWDPTMVPLQFLDMEQEYKRVPHFVSKG
ncbi:hypothetical protein DUI87_28067 [Hirundo rustica rustica]|uniref:Uncharacterized protein n=1 Tax=Hirundo rustica rustica TaxID=333673 RepID=A0A3M0J3R5_HIRRU|nr:hypothetical protein DUI87_28067 [Hirundo rustica rustica]